MTFLKKRADYLAARGGPGAGTSAFLLVARRRGDGDPGVRAGFTVTRKIGGAVVRNRIRRRLREAARAILPVHGEAGCDYVFIARRHAATRKYADLLDDMKRALLRLAPDPT